MSGRRNFRWTTKHATVPTRGSTDVPHFIVPRQRGPHIRVGPADHLNPTVHHDPMTTTPGRPEELHLQPPTDSGREPLDSSGSCEPFLGGVATAERRRVPAAPPRRLAKVSLLSAHPLRSTPITGASSLLLDGPPPADSSLLSPLAGLASRVFA
jgi:hypothetical protein